MNKTLWPESKIINLDNYEGVDKEKVTLLFVFYPRIYDNLIEELGEKEATDLLSDASDKKKVYVYYHKSKDDDSRNNFELVIGDYVFNFIVKEPEEEYNYYDFYSDNDDTDEAEIGKDSDVSAKIDNVLKSDNGEYCFLIIGFRRKNTYTAKNVARNGICILSEQIGFIVRRGANNDTTIGNYIACNYVNDIAELILVKSNSRIEIDDNKLNRDWKDILSYAEKFTTYEDDLEKTQVLIESTVHYTSFKVADQSTNDDAMYEFIVDKMYKGFEINTRVEINDLDLNIKPPIVGTIINIEDKTITLVFHKQVAVDKIPTTGIVRIYYTNVQTRVKLDVIDKLRKLEAGKNLNDIFKEYKTAGFSEIDITDLEKEWSTRKFPPNRSQMEAIKNGIGTKDITLVLGPPGTGKTTVILDWVNYFVKQGKRVLISSQNNKAVDNVLARLEFKDKILRIGNAEKVEEGVKDILYQQKASGLSDDLLIKAKENQEEFKKLIDKTKKDTKTRIDSMKKKTDVKVEKYQNTRDNTIKSLNNNLEKNKKKLKEYINSFNTDFADYTESMYAEIHDSIIKQYKELEDYYIKINDLEKRVKNLESKIKNKLNIFRFIHKIEYREKIVCINKLIEQYNDIEKKLENNNNKLEVAKLKKWIEDNGFIIKTHKGLYDDRFSDFEFIVKYKEQLNSINEIDFNKYVQKEVEHIRSGKNQQIKQAKKDLELFITKEEQTLKDSLDRINILIKENDIWVNELQIRNDAIVSEILINTMKVIGATCVGINSNRLFRDVHFDITIIDESGQIQLHNVLIPMSRSEKIIMLGDHKQIPPMPNQDVLEYVKQLDYDEGHNKPTPQELYENSFFQYLYERAIPESNKVLLDTQFRMPNTVADIISKAFYDNKYYSGDIKKNMKSLIPSLFKEPLCLIDTIDALEERKETQDKKDGQVKYYNIYEANVIVSIIKYIVTNNLVDKAEIGIIVPYSRQLKYIREVLSKKLSNLLTKEEIKEMVGTLDSFQGQERDLIIYGITRSNDRKRTAKRIGFLSELRRFNVALTRCKKQVVVIGDFKFLMECENDGPELTEADLFDFENNAAVYKPSTEKQFGEFVKLMVDSVKAGNGAMIPSKEICERIDNNG